MIIALLLGLSACLFVLPSCFLTEADTKKQLTSRIEVEQSARLDHFFARQTRSQWWLVGYLRRNKPLADKLMQRVGLDKKGMELRLSRLRWNIAMEEILLAKCIGGILLIPSVAVIAWFLLHGEKVGIVPLLPLFCALLVYMLPTILIEKADKQAQNEIREQIPLFFSIIQALVEAGMPIHTAIRATAARYSGRLGQEMAMLDIEERQYGNWRKALEEMAFRWDVDVLIALVSEINEAMTKGVAIAPLLAGQVEEQLRLQEDEMTDYVNKMSIRLLPILIIFMGVPLLFLVMGPSFMGIKATL
ncbi:type II secretion system F family protein [Brevibacillus dissolubilis]|uniref:type II secretion system F family protein n=1 Tax=Brevibacillus dissolubilis TaxID=1844116 RepID=UPI001116FEDE|nr:type II secretion system F family protein [Brevibacillus dissolubilis]